MNLKTPKTKQVRNFVSVVKGKPPAIVPFFGPGSERYLSPEYLRGTAEAEFVKPGANAIRITDGDTIVLWDGSNAGEFFRGRGGILASTMAQLRQSDDVNGHYFYYALKVWEPFLKGQTSGSGIPHVDKEILSRIEILLFDSNEQAKIAEILSTVDQAIEQTEALIAKQQRIKTGLMQDLLTRGIDEQGNIRSEETHQFKDSPIGRIPVEWEVQSIEAVAIDEPNSTAIGPFGSDLIAADYRSEGVPVVFVRDIRESGFSWISNVYVTQEKSRKLKAHLAKSGDVLATKMGLPPCVAAVYPLDMSEGVITADVIKLTPNKRMVLSEWVATMLNTLQVRAQVRRITGGVTRPKVTLADFRRLLILVPSVHEQKRIMDILGAEGNVLNSEVSELNKLHALKVGLMQDLLTGETRVTSLLREEEVTSQ